MIETFMKGLDPSIKALWRKLKNTTSKDWIIKTIEKHSIKIFGCKYNKK